MRWPVETEEEVVEADGPVGLEAVAHGGEVDGAVMLVDLDGVAAAEGDVGAPFPGEVGEDSLAADFAGGVWGGGVDLAALVGPEVVAQEGTAHQVGLMGEVLEGFGGLDGSCEVDRG